MQRAVVRKLCGMMWVRGQKLKAATGKERAIPATFIRIYDPESECAPGHMCMHTMLPIAGQRAKSLHGKSARPEACRIDIHERRCLKVTVHVPKGYTNTPISPAPRQHVGKTMLSCGAFSILPLLITFPS